MATPALRALRTELPTETKIHWIGRPGPLAVLEGLPWCDGTLSYKPRAKQAGSITRSLFTGSLSKSSPQGKTSKQGNAPMNRRGLVRAMRDEKFDAILYLTNSLSTALLGALAGIPRRIGYARDYRSFLLTDSIRVRDGLHDAHRDPCIINYLRLVQSIGCIGDDKRTELGLLDSDQAIGQRCIESIGLPSEREFILINTGAATAATKRWPIEQAAAAASELARDLGLSVLIHCGPAERDNANAIESLAGHPWVKSMGRFDELPLGLSKALIARSRMVISTDSGPRHIAVAMNKPVVSLFGSVDPSLTRSYNIPETILTVGLACQPCGSYNCRFKHANCMKQLDSDRVVRAAKLAYRQASLSPLPLVNVS